MWEHEFDRVPMVGDVLAMRDVMELRSAGGWQLVAATYENHDREGGCHFLFWKRERLNLFGAGRGRQ